MDITTPTIETSIIACTKTPIMDSYQTHELSNSIGKNGHLSVTVDWLQVQIHMCQDAYVMII